MLLFRADEYRTLELCRALAVEKVSMKIQALARANLTRRYLDKVKAVRPQLNAAVESRNLAKLDQALLLVSEVSGSNRNTPYKHSIQYNIHTSL